jgi:aromatic ring-cleaving dioxygenase
LEAAFSGFFYVQDERYVMVPWMAKNDDVQAVLSHPWLHGISASMHVDEQYVMVPWMAKNDDIQAVLSHPWLHGISASMHVDERYVAATWM